MSMPRVTFNRWRDGSVFVTFGNWMTRLEICGHACANGWVKGCCACAEVVPRERCDTCRERARDRAHGREVTPTMPIMPPDAIAVSTVATVVALVLPWVFGLFVLWSKIR